MSFDTFCKLGSIESFICNSNDTSFNIFKTI